MHRRRSRPASLRLLLTTAFVSPLLACGARPAGEVVPPIQAPGSDAASTTTASAEFPTVGRFGTPGLPDYAAVEGLPATEAETALRPVIPQASNASAAVSCAAREYAIRFAADGADPGPGTVAAFSQHCGLWAPPPDAFAFTAKGLEAAGAQLEKVPGDLRARVAALGAVTHPTGAVTVVLLTPPQGLTLDAKPRRLGPAGAGKLAGRRTGTSEGALWVLASKGEREVVEQPIVTGADGRFELDLPDVRAGDGSAVFEVVRVEGAFTRSLAVLRLSATPPESYPPPPAPLANPGREAQESTLLGAVNVARRATGQAPVQTVANASSGLDAWLETVATGATTGAPVGLADDRGWPFHRLRYTFSAGVTAGEAIAALAATPLGRRALLDPDDQRMAFGVRPFGTQPGIDVVVVSLTPFQAPDEAGGRAALLTAVNGRRRTLGLTPLVSAPALDAVAQALAADALRGAVAWEAVVSAAGKELMRREVAVSAYGAGGVARSTFDPGALSDDVSLLRKDMRALGVGLVSGPIAGQGNAQVAVVYVVADQVPKLAK